MPALRFRRHRPHTAGLHPLATVGICLAVAVALTLIVGNLLRLWLDEETYRKLTEGDEEPSSPPPLEKTDVPNVNAYPFSLDEEVDRVIGSQAVSVPLNTPDGNLLYTSNVSAYLGISGGSTPLFDKMRELSAFVPYVSGVFYPQAFSQSLDDVFFVAAAEESALLREFLHTGGDEILLCGLPLTADSLDRVVEYLTMLGRAMPNDAIGVAVPRSVAADAENWEILATLVDVCDFVVLDLTAEEVADEEEVSPGEPSPAALTLLSDCSYLISLYRTRLLVSSAQSALLSTLEVQMYPNYQVLD